MRLLNKRLISLFLVMVMVLSMTPLTAYATIATELTDTTEVTEATESTDATGHIYENGICTGCGIAIPAPEWEVGTIASANGLNNVTTTRLRTVDYYRLTDFGAVGINRGYTMTNFVYDENYTYLGTSSWLGSGVGFTTEILQETYPTGVYFRIVLRHLDQTTLTVDDLKATGVTFYAPGEDIPARESGLSYEDVMSVGSWQDGAIWDSKLFVLGAGGSGAVYDMASQAKLSSLTLDNTDALKPHANSVCFGNTYYAKGDVYPLLYVNIYNNYSSADDRMEGTCCVYRVTETDGIFNTELVQVIEIGFTEDLTLWKSKENNGDVRPYGNFVVDTDKNKLYAFVMRDADKTTRFFRFDLPTLAEGNYSDTYGCNEVTLESDDIEAQFDTTYFNYLQGCCYCGGKILSVEGFNSGSSAEPTLRIVDPASCTVEKIYFLADAGLTKEPEVVCVDPDTGILYYAAADGVLRILTIDGVHFHSYKSEITAPTCTEKGYTTYTCTCGDSYVDDYTDELGHYSAKAETLADGDSLVLTAHNVVKHNKAIIFSAEVENLGDGLIRICHGQKAYSGSHIEITADKLLVYSTYKEVSVKEYAHGLTIAGDVYVRLDVIRTNAKITIVTASGTFSKSVSWAGCNGEIACGVEGTALKNVDIRWFARGVESDYWFFGDSWFSTNSSARWTTYLLDDGYMDILLCGYGGMGAPAGLKQFKELLQIDTPEYAVWALGMNNGDRNGKINASWLSATEEFLALCKEYGITPILCTIPTTPNVNNRLKNAWVENSGYRYIDFDLAVVENHATGEWFDDTAASDLNHPTTLGAQILYPQVFADFPELAGGDPATCTHKLYQLGARDAECAHGGRNEYYVCSLCGSAFADPVAAATTTTAEMLLAPKGHSFGEWTQSKAPTCTESGTEQRQCANCDNTETREVKEIGHSYESGICIGCGQDTVAVIIEDGTLTITCAEPKDSTLLYLAAYDQNDRFLSIKIVAFGESIDCPEGEKFVIFFLNENLMPLRKQKEI